MTTPDPLSASSSQWPQVKQLFERLVDLPPAERAAALAQAAVDSAVRNEVLSLLAHHDRSEAGGGFMSGAAAVQVLGRAGTERQGQRFGPWEIVASVGSGGMGEVYEARRADGQFEGRAAIKLLKRGMDSASVLQRFAHERQALARLNHPHIARLFDAGLSGDGLPYFVMEYVEGVPIDQAVRERPLRERLALFLQLGDAVAHAHRNLLVHRDLKPGNVLVTPQGQVKLLDFGIAKALDPVEGNGGDTTMGAERPFTPNYASPEQVRGEPVTTATDIYSLGVLLYQLLTGLRPTGRSATTPAQAARSVLEETPSKPSSLSPDLVNDPLWMSQRKQLEGDLDNVLLKALEKPVERRYASVDALVQDVRNYLDGYPVTARAPSWGYLVGKFVSRNKLPVGAAVLALLAVVVGAGATAWQARQAELARASAERRLKDIRGIASAVVIKYSDAITHLPGGMKLKEQLLTDTLRYLDRLMPEAEADPQFKAEIAMAYARLADIQVTNGLNSLDNNEAGDKSADKALALFAPAEAGQPADPLFYLWWARSLGSKAFIARAKGDVDAAIASVGQAPAIIQRGLRRFPDNVDLLTELGSARLRLGQMQYTVTLANKGQPDAAMREFNQAYDIYTRLLDLETKGGKGHDPGVNAFQLGTIEGARALVYSGQGKTSDAIAHGRAAVDFKLRAMKEDPNNVSMRSGLTSEANNLTTFCLDAEDSRCALEAITLGWNEMQKLVHDEPDNQGWKAGLNAMALHHGRALAASGQLARALEVLKLSEDSLAQRVASGKAGPPQVRRLAWTRMAQAAALQQQGQGGAARQQADAAAKALEELTAKTPKDRDAWLLLGELGWLRSQWGLTERATGLQLARDALGKAQALGPLTGRHALYWSRLPPA